MSYLVLGLGAFLWLCGAIAIYTGYGIIEVERGWASVIAGSVAFSSGIVTLALGLILHRLTRLHAILKAGQGVTPPLRELAWRTDYEPSSDALPESSFAQQPAAVPPVPSVTAAPGIPPAPSPRSWAHRPMRPNLAAARNFLKPRGTVPAARGIPEADYSAQKAPPFSRNGLKDQAEPEPAFEPGFTRPAEVAGLKTEGEARTAFAPPGEMAAERSARLDLEPGLFDRAAEEKIGAPSFDEPFPEIPENPEVSRVPFEPGVSWPAETAAIETIFEEELFIELHRKPETRTGEPASSPASATTERQTMEALQSITGDGQEELAIVGQYQSAGTSYIMYSDGSIEARTEHAVFHFKSMTELKVFMDSEARTSKE
jgi:hypothetical protein